MEFVYDEWVIQTKYTENNFYIKFINSINKSVIYENIIKQEDIKMPINKFIKLFENCLNKVKDYKLTFDLETDSEQELNLLFNYESEIFDIRELICLKKITSTDVDIFQKLFELENKIREQNMIVIGKIFNLKTLNDENNTFYDLTWKTISYPADTEYIEFIVPQQYIDPTTNIVNTFHYELNFSIEPCVIFTNLKKIKINLFQILYYFSSTFSYENHKRFIRSELIISNHNVEEISFVQTDRNHLSLSYMTSKSDRLDFKKNDIWIMDKCHYKLQYLNNNNYEEILNFTKLKKITIDDNNMGPQSHRLFHKLITSSKNLNNILIHCSNNMNEIEFFNQIKTYCKNKNIDLQINYK